MRQLPDFARRMKILAVGLSLLLTSCLPVRQPEDWSATKAGEENPFKNTPISSPRERFDRLLDPIESTLKSAKQERNFESKIGFLMQGGLIESLRYFQVLIYIYQKKYPELEKYYEDAKALENHIGHQSDLQAFYQEAVSSGKQEAIEKRKKLLDDGVKAFRDYVSDSKWFASGTDLVDELRSVLNKIKWDNLEDDRNMVLSRISKKMKSQYENEYDLNLPEEGMHELRRDVRRFSYLNLVAGDIAVDDLEGSCPLGGAVVPEPNPGPTDDYFCHIHRCITDKLTSISSALVPLKYQGSLQQARGEPVDPRIISAAKDLYSDLMKSKAYLYLRSSLLTCRTKKESAADKAKDPLDK